LLPPYPNPTRTGAWIGWETPSAAPVTIEILTVSGRRIWSARQPAEAGKLWWNGEDSAGRKVPSGAYFVRVSVGGASLVGTSILVRR
jgi:flagellar hook assembly protein FlgD